LRPELSGNPFMRGSFAAAHKRLGAERGIWRPKNSKK